MKLFKSFFICLAVFLVTGKAIAIDNNTDTWVSGEDSAYDDFVNQLNGVDMQDDAAFEVGGQKVADQCKSFIMPNGGLGSLGKFARQEVAGNEVTYSTLLHASTMNKICPRYSTLSILDRGLVWAIVLTTMAHYESSCNAARTADGPNGTARGLFQLHQGHEADYDDDNKCIKNASFNERDSVRCALGMLMSQLEKHAGQLFTNHSYWDVLRPNGASQRADNIAAALAKSKLCSNHLD